MKNSTIISTLSVAMLLTGACSSKKINNEYQGKIKKETISVSSKIPGRILKIYVSEGAMVKKGDTLALIDLPEVETKIEQAKGALFSADAQYEMALNGATSNQLKQLDAKYTGLKEQYDFADKSFQRIKNMYKDSLVSKQRYDEVYAKLKGAQAQLDAVTAELDEARKGVRQESKDMALGQKERAQGAVKEANVAMSERYILAPDDMSIETITLHQGELALAGYALFNGYLTNTTYFRFTVGESKIANFKPNMDFTLDVPYLKKSIGCKVISVKQLSKYAEVSSAFPDYEMSESIYEVKLKPDAIVNGAEFLANASVTLKK